jgi:hypothetical protein
MEFSGGSEENHERPEDNQSPGRDLNIRPSEYHTVYHELVFHSVIRCMFMQRFKMKV